MHRKGQIINQLQQLNLKVVTHSSNDKNLKNIDIYLVDTFGDSKNFYQITNTVFLGGSIINHGGQNPLEPARFGARILHGPNTDNFKEVYAYLRSLKISQRIINPSELAKKIIFKKNMKKVSKINYLGKIILKRTIKELNKPINNEF